MNNRIVLEEPAELLVGKFGKGQLVQTITGRFELRGGTLSDLVEAREWASLFMPEAIVRAPAARR
jgi:hypothetical protein